MNNIAAYARFAWATAAFYFKFVISSSFPYSGAKFPEAEMTGGQAVASCFVIAEVLRGCSGGPIFHDASVRVCSLADAPLPLSVRLESLDAQPFRDLKLTALR